ncbi:17294_t:CDS:2, partial [Gigaspora rosea]
MENENTLETFEEQPLTGSSAKVRRYACEHQGCNITKNKTSIVKNQRQTRSKRNGCRWQIRASCPKTTGILKINSLCLNHNDYPIKDDTNKFATKYRTFSEEMLKNIKFWTKTDLSNAIQTFKRQNYVECEAAVLLNHLFEQKAEDTGKKERWALCHTSKIFTAGMQSTQRVEDQNGIIKNSVNSSTTLINLVKYINKQIDRASTFVKYKNWIHSITGSTLIYASSEFSPEIDKWITSYLTPVSLSIQRQEIAQAIWYTSRLINFQDLGFNSIEQADLIEQSDLNEEFNLTEESDTNGIFDTFVEDIVDAPATLVKELISTMEVELIREVWKAYVTINGLSKKAIQAGLNAGSSAIQ